jgi:hypothetical protein
LKSGSRIHSLAAGTLLLALISVGVVAMSVSNEELVPRRAGDHIRVIAPRLHFLTGKSLQRLHDGAIVPFDFQLSVAAGAKSNVVERTFERFTVSYDVWEEKFSVVRPRDFRKSASNLSANAAESWCLENLLARASSVWGARELWARLEVRSAEPKEPTSFPYADPGISITTLIGIFSRPPRPAQDHWAFESAAFRLADLKP